MDDGHFYHNAVFLNVQSFNDNENLLLVSALRKFGLTSKVIPVSVKDKNKHFAPASRIFIPALNITKLRELVLPYMTPSMYYKLGL